MLKQVGRVKGERNGGIGNEKHVEATEKERQHGVTHTHCVSQQPKDSYANWAEMRCRALFILA